MASRFELKKYITIPEPGIENEVQIAEHLVGRFVGTSFRRVCSFDSFDKAEKFIETYQTDNFYPLCILSVYYSVSLTKYK